MAWLPQKANHLSCRLFHRLPWKAIWMMKTDLGLQRIEIDLSDEIRAQLEEGPRVWSGIGDQPMLIPSFTPTTR